MFFSYLFYNTNLFAFSIPPFPLAKNFTNELGIDESTALISKISPSTDNCAPKCWGPPDFAWNCTNLIFLLLDTLKLLMALIVSHDLSNLFNKQFFNNFFEAPVSTKQIFEGIPDLNIHRIHSIINSN